MDLDATIREMAGRGETAARIAAAVGKTRNAVVGYCYRRKIALRPASPGRPRADEAKAAPVRTTPVATGRLRNLMAEARGEIAIEDRAANLPWPEPARGGIGIPFIDTKFGECRRPMWGPKQRIGNVCGLRVEVGTSYCAGCSKFLLSDTYTY